MVTGKGNVYYLWLTPQSDVRDRFAEVIRKLSQTYHTKLFEPHITLVGGITGPEDELIAKTEKLARRLTRLTIKPLEIQYLDEFYRSLFLLVTPTEALINANKLAKQQFGLPVDEEFMPHLSLFYGDLTVREKEKIKGRLNSKLLAPFHVDKIVLFCTISEPDKWYTVQSFPLATTV